MREMYDVLSLGRRASEFFHISPSIKKVKHVFVYLKKTFRNANNHRLLENTPFIMDTFRLDGASLCKCRPEYGNGV